MSHQEYSQRKQQFKKAIKHSCTENKKSFGQNVIEAHIIGVKVNKLVAILVLSTFMMSFTY